MKNFSGICIETFLHCVALPNVICQGITALKYVVTVLTPKNQITLSPLVKTVSLSFHISIINCVIYDCYIRLKWANLQNLELQALGRLGLARHGRIYKDKIWLPIKSCIALIDGVNFQWCIISKQSLSSKFELVAIYEIMRLSFSSFVN